MEVMLNQHVIPIINENDTISVTELMFTDNDELSGLIATMMNADTLIILSNVQGIYTGNPADPQSKLLTSIKPGEQHLDSYIQSGKSSFGRGGMLTKCKIACQVANEGIEVFIANGKEEDILEQIAHHPETTQCTRFIPGEKNVRNGLHIPVIFPKESSASMPAQKRQFPLQKPAVFYWLV